ncbi:hypothetical protein Amsp01_041830 [Amycolatopsis sp. NBRC 101858]|nr:hypothetical protein Amsp01_041830 [Amycolatopsis sp. NBRC 101858]
MPHRAGSGQEGAGTRGVVAGAGFVGVGVGLGVAVAAVVAGAGGTDAVGSVLVAGEALWSLPHPATASPHTSARKIVRPRMVSRPG